MEAEKKTGELIKAARKKAKLTQAELGAKLGVTPAAISQFEKPSSNPTFDTIEKIADALNISVDNLIPNSFDRNVQIGTELSAIDYGFIEAMVNHKVFTDKEREEIFRKIERCKATLAKISDGNELLEYSEKTHNELEQTILKIILSKPNCAASDAIIILSCFLSLKKQSRDFLIEILLENCYSDLDLKYT